MIFFFAIFDIFLYLPSNCFLLFVEIISNSSCKKKLLKEILFRNVSFLLCDCKSSAKTHWVKVCQFKNSRSLFKNVNVVPMRDFSLQVFSVENWLFVGWKVSILKLNFRNSHYSGQIKFIFRFSLNQKSSI